jgi:sucrose phosphorylase
MKPVPDNGDGASPSPADPAALERIGQRLEDLYGVQTAPYLRRRLARILETHRQLRTRRVKEPCWSHRDIVLITYGDSIQSPAHAPLQTLRAFLRRHLPVECSMVHLLPFFPWSSDDGFAVTDFRAVNPELGSWEDVAALEQCYDLVIDLVLNHCSRENLWFFDFVAGQEPACNYFLAVDPTENLSMVTRPRSTPVLTGVRTPRGMKHVWATFSNDQVDLDYRNPDVLLEMIDIMLYYVRRGARVLRLDAVAYLWKEVGTRCIHLPQTHALVKLFRDLLQLVEPGALILTETNVPHEENVSYFGQGDEAHLVYQFSLPPLLLHAIHAGVTRHLYTWARGIETMVLPEGCSFLNFTASHDGVGLRPLEGLVPADEVRALLDAMRERGGYISTRRDTDGSESPYELNISYFDACGAGASGDVDRQIAAFLLSQTVALSFRGIPAVYIHSLLATPNDHIGVERTGMTRAINRRKWDRGELERLLATPHSTTARVFSRYRHLLQVRRRQPAFHPDAAQRILRLEDGLFALERTATDHSQRLLAVYNFTGRQRRAAVSDLATDLSRRRELIGQTPVAIDKGELLLPPYAAFWFSDARA